ncbi:TRAP transporter substrate-binding protein [Desulfobacula sp.]|uniref:TRAP transporter substrate-binding protein n=1 Tax=Desulfobacula sp. TaxID=2593537 RepID=UPI001EB48EDF|nr:TRAP transporter substrate-binding protein DctP [Desulfobacula sp.]
MKNQRLKIGLVLVLFFIAFLVLSQGKKGNGLNSKVDKQGTIYNLKFGHDMPVNSAQHIAALKYAERVEQKTKGRVRIKVYPNQELGTDQEMIGLARSGQLDIILPPTAKLSTLVPALQLVDLPFVFSSREEIYPILDGEPGKHLLELLEPQGLIGFTFWESGFKQFTANKEIRTPNDFKGLNIRVMKSRLINGTV